MAKRLRRVFAILLLTISILLFPAATGVLGASAYKAPTANPTFSWGAIVSGNYTNVQTSNNSYMRVREGAFFFFFWSLDSTWGGWQAFSEAPRERLLDIRVELEGYQSESSDTWAVQFYDYEASSWDSTSYSLESFPTTPKATRQIAVGDAARARRFVSTAGAFQLRLTSGWDFSRTDLYIDLLRVRFVYDDVPPVSAVVSPTSGELTRESAYRVSGTAYDPAPDASGVAGVEVSVNGGAWSPAAPVSPGDYSGWYYDWSVPSEGTYVIRSRARDGAGNVEAPGPGVTLTADWTPPAVSGTSPADGASPVAVTTAVKAELYDANGIDASTVNGDTFLLFGEGGGAVEGNVSYDPENMTATFTPQEELSYGVTYTAVLTTGITDRAGNPMASEHAWDFTTAPQPPEYVYADDSGWEAEPDGAWHLEPYSQLDPPLTGQDLLVANDAGATASYAIPAGYTRVTLASAKHWQCGMAEVLLDGVKVAEVDLFYDSDDIDWGVVIYENHALDPSTPHTVTLRAKGEGGPGVVWFGGVQYDLSWMHFVNVQWLKFW